MTANGRRYDVVLFGASGFTGRQAVAYFARHAPAGLRWAIAGRDRGKIQALGAPVDALVADSGNQASVDAVARQTHVVLNTAGPFARYGTPVVDACVRCRTHYVDITGETFWVQQLIDRFDADADSRGIRIVPCCGFDSVPSDLGAFVMARHHHASTVRAYFQIGGGGLNGGTIASVANMVGSQLAREVTRAGGGALPRFDRLAGAWVAPFFMASINSWVVRRSASLFARWGEPYPEGFTYQERLKFTPPLAAPKAIAAAVATGLAAVVLRSPPLFRAILPLLPEPGSGPSDKKMDDGWFSCDVVGRTGSGDYMRMRIANDGDAGNRSTVKMLCESAFCLALGESTERGGILTPATAFGDRLVRRLRAAGMTFSE